MKGDCKAVVLTTFALFYLSSAVHGQTIINFDNLPPGTTVTNQYAAQGVEFGPSPFGVTGLGVEVVNLESGSFKAAHSGTQVANISRGGEIGQTDIWGQFDELHQSVSVFVGSFMTLSHPVKLVVTDISGTQIAEVEHIVPGHSGASTSFSVTSSIANIAFFRIFRDDNDFSAQLIFIDDLSFDTPTITSPPDFAINALFSNSIWVAPSSSTMANFVIHRINGSSGNISFSVSGLPLGVGGTYSPNPSAGSEGAPVNLSLTAAPGTVSSQYTVTVTANPTPSAGTSPHSIKFQLLIGPLQPANTPFTVKDVSPDGPFNDPANQGMDPAGRIKSLVIDPTNNSILYAAGNSAGVWKSTDAAHSWQQSSVGLRTGFTVNDQSLAVDANNPNRLLYATVNSDGRNLGLGGLWVSLDAAATWQHVVLPNCSTPNINSVTFTSGQPFVAADCNIYTSTDADLVHGNWQALPQPPFATAGAHLQGLNLGSQAIIGNQTIFACTAGSALVYRSRSLGNSWDPPVDLKTGNNCIRLAVAPLTESQPSTILVSHQVSVGANREITIVNFNTVTTQDLDFSSYASSGSGVDSVFAVLRKSASPGEAQPGLKYDIYAGDSCAFYSYASPNSPIWSKLQGGGPPS